MSIQGLLCPSSREETGLHLSDLASLYLVDMMVIENRGVWERDAPQQLDAGSPSRGNGRQTPQVPAGAAAVAPSCRLLCGAGLPPACG